LSANFRDGTLSRLGLNEGNLFRLDTLADDHASESPRPCDCRFARRRRVARGCGTRLLQARGAEALLCGSGKGAALVVNDTVSSDKKSALAWRDPDKDLAT
jgi:hypothetical protein